MSWRMKWCALVVALCALVLATGAAWNRRFEVRRGLPELHVGDGAGGGFAVEKARGEKPFAKVFGLPFGGEVEALHVRISGRAVDLVADGEEWRDGRLILEWQDTEGMVKVRDTVMTMQGHGKPMRGSEMIVRCAEAGLFPALRVEHLGLSGRMEVNGLRFVAVRERVWVKWVLGGLFVGWGLWCYGFVRAFTQASRVRVAVAAALLLAMGWLLVVPGPWAHARPLAGGFRTGGEPGSMVRVEVSRASGIGHDVEPLAELRQQGGLVLQVKKTLFFLRPLLHAVLFAVPALVVVLLCGARCAWGCGVLASCAVELGQLGFGFGFDWVDATDLLVNLAGIALALWAWRRWMGGCECGTRPDFA